MLAFLTFTHTQPNTHTLIQALMLYDAVAAIAAAAAAAATATAAMAAAAAGTLRVSCAAPYCQPLLSVYGKRKQGVIFFAACQCARLCVRLAACAKMR